MNVKCFRNELHVWALIGRTVAERVAEFVSWRVVVDTNGRYHIQHLCGDDAATWSYDNLAALHPRAIDGGVHLEISAAVRVAAGLAA
jgi:hypothetical protein